MKAIAISLILASTIGAQPLLALEQQDLERAKAATVFAKTGAGTGTAFCIDSSKGFFLTNYHVIEGSPATVTLTAYPGKDTKESAKATVLLADPENDLALLRADFKAEIPALPLGIQSELSETDVLTAFGYPFGTELAADGISPAISVNIGRITSLRRKEGKLSSIQTDASVNRGNSGGPMLSESGEVVGIVRSGYGLAGLNFAIPPEVFTSFLEQPFFLTNIGEKGPVDFSKENEFTIRVSTVLPNSENYTFDFYLDSITLQAAEVANDTFTLKIPVSSTEVQTEALPHFKIVARLDGVITCTLSGKIRNAGAKAPLKHVFTMVEATSALEISPGKSGLPVPPASDLSPILTLAPIERLTEERTIEFDEPFSRVSPGGHGRYLVFYFPASRKIRVFDLASLQFMGDPLLVGSGDLLVAAGAKRILAVDRFEGHAYSIPFDTLEVENSNSLPWSGTPFQIEMGRSSDSSAVISYKSSEFSEAPHMQPYFLSIPSLEPLDIEVNGAPELSELRIRSSANGEVLTFTNSDCVGTTAILGTEKLFHQRNTIKDQGWKMPSLDGTHLLKCCGAIQTLLGQRLAFYPSRRLWLFHHLPSGHPAFYVSVGSKPNDNEEGHEISLIPNGELRPVISLEGRFPDLDNISDHDFRFDRFSWDDEDLTYDRRVHMIPQLQILATLPVSNEEMVLRPISFEENEETDSGQLRYVNSIPGTEVNLGDTYGYQLKWNSPASVIQFDKVTAPASLSISKKGKVEWKPDAADAGRNHQIVVRLTDEDGNCRFHSFSILVKSG